MNEEPMSVVTTPGCRATNVKPCAAVTANAQLSVTARMQRCLRTATTLWLSSSHQQLLILMAIKDAKGMRYDYRHTVVACMVERI